MISRSGVRELQFKVLNPQLEQVRYRKGVAEQRSGRKRFDIHKNSESIYADFGYITKLLEKKEGQSRMNLFGQGPETKFLFEPAHENGHSVSNCKLNPLPQSIANNRSANNTKFTTVAKENKNNSVSPIIKSSFEVLNNRGNARNDIEWDSRIKREIENNRNSSMNYREKENLSIAARNKSESPSKQVRNSITDRGNEIGENDKYVEKLQAELKIKESELQEYQNLINEKLKSNAESLEAFSKLNRLEQEKRRYFEQQRINSLGLDMQILEKVKEKQAKVEKKEREQIIRLEMLKFMREQEFKDRYERAAKAKEYKEQLDFQAQYNKTTKINQNPKENYEATRKSPIFHYNAPNPFKNTTGSSNSSVISGFTRKFPKTLCYNPITGDRKDTSKYIFGGHPLIVRDLQQFRHVKPENEPKD
jgi:hypothetical protein